MARQASCVAKTPTLDQRFGGVAARSPALLRRDTSTVDGGPLQPIAEFAVRPQSHEVTDGTLACFAMHDQFEPVGREILKHQLPVGWLTPGQRFASFAMDDSQLSSVIEDSDSGMQTFSASNPLPLSHSPLEIRHHSRQSAPAGRACRMYARQTTS